MVSNLYLFLFSYRWDQLTFNQGDSKLYRQVAKFGPDFSEFSEFGHDFQLETHGVWK